MPVSTCAVYVVPLRWSVPRPLEAMTSYLAGLSRWVEVVVVDSSPAEVFEQHRAAWGPIVRHVRSAPPPPGRNGKVLNVLRGLEITTQELVVVADDDVRYTPASLAAVLARLERCDVVRPQNFFAPLPWFARWDTARTLLNRAVSADYPGTLALRRSALPDGYASDVLFENLEMLRTVRAHGGREDAARDLFVAREPGDVRTFAGQRVRQAYDSQAQPVRLAIELALLPAAAAAFVQAVRAHGSWGALVTGVVLSGALVLVAETGRRRDDGPRVFPASCAVWAPAWVAERAVCAWVALAHRCAGGVPYAGGRLRRAAHSERWLRARARARAASGASHRPLDV